MPCRAPRSRRCATSRAPPRRRRPATRPRTGPATRPAMPTKPASPSDVGVAAPFPGAFPLASRVAFTRVAPELVRRPVMKNLGQMMKQAQEMQARMAEMQAKLDQVEVTGAAGGAPIIGTANSKAEPDRINIAPALV